MALSIRLLAKERQEQTEENAEAPSRRRLGFLFGTAMLQLTTVRLYITDEAGRRRRIRRPRSDDQIWDEYKRGFRCDVRRQLLQRARLHAWMEARALAEACSIFSTLNEDEASDGSFLDDGAMSDSPALVELDPFGGEARVED